LYIRSALHPDAVASLVTPEHVLNSAVDTYNLRIDNTPGRRHALARGGPRGQPRTTATLEADDDARLLLKDPTSGPTLAHHNILRGMMRNMSLIMHSEDTRHLPLSELNRGMEAWMRTPVDTNMYFTPYRTAVSAFGLHQDSMDVVIVQVAGRKVWSVYPTVFRSPDSGQTLPELFQAPLNQDNVLSHVASVHRFRTESSVRTLHHRKLQTGGAAVADAAKTFLGGSVSSTFAQGTKPFTLQGSHTQNQFNRSSTAGEWVKLPINITMSPGDVLYIPHGTPHAAMPVPDDTPPGINDRKWDAQMEQVLHSRTNSTQSDMDHSSSLTHHLTVGLLYSQQRLIVLLEEALEISVQREVLSPETRDAINMATKYLRQEEEDVHTMGSANVDTLNVYGNVSGTSGELLADSARSFMGQVLQDDMREAWYTQDALPALLRSVVYTNVLAPRSMFPAFHPCHPRRTFHTPPGHSKPLSVKVDMACSVVSYGADSAPETWREWTKSEVLEAAIQLEDLVAANKRKAQHRWVHGLVALHDLLHDSGGSGPAAVLAKLFGLKHLLRRRFAAQQAKTSIDAALARINCGDTAVFDSVELATHGAHTWLQERSAHTQAQSSNYGRLVKPAELDAAAQRLAAIEESTWLFSPGEKRHARIASRTPEFWDEHFAQPAFVMDAGQVNAGSSTKAGHGHGHPPEVADIFAENAGISRLSAGTLFDAVQHNTTLFRRRSDVPAMMVGSMPEQRSSQVDETLFNTYYTRFFGSRSAMLHQAGLTTDHFFGTVEHALTPNVNKSIARAATVSTSTNLCVGGDKPLLRLSQGFHGDQRDEDDAIVPMLLIYNSDVLRFRSPEIAAAAQAMVSYPPGVPFTPLDACVEGLVQLRRQDHMFFAVKPESTDASTSPAMLLQDWQVCTDMSTAIEKLAVLLSQLDALVLDSGAAPQVFATFSLTEHIPQVLPTNSSANTVPEVNKRIFKRHKRARTVAEALGIEFPAGSMQSAAYFQVNATAVKSSQQRQERADNTLLGNMKRKEAGLGVGSAPWASVEARMQSTLHESGMV